MNIPKKLKVGGHTYTVNIVKGDNALCSPQYLGRTSHNKNTIDLEEEIPDSKREEVFLHEILHICFDQGGIDREYKEEEYLVNTLSNQLYSILKDNKII